jgi:hypothetical protein
VDSLDSLNSLVDSLNSLVNSLVASLDSSLLLPPSSHLTKGSLYGSDIMIKKTSGWGLGISELLRDLEL